MSKVMTWELADHMCKGCGGRGPCPDCGLSLNDFGPDEETGAGK